MNLHPVDSIRALYVEVPKAACTSVKMALAPHRRPGPPPENAEAMHRWFGYTYASGEAELDAWIAAHWIEFFRFTVVRDPITRFESLYYGKVNEGGIDEFALTFAESSWAQDPHGQCQVELVGRELGKYELVARMENLEPLEWALTQLVGRPVRMPHVNRSERGPALGAQSRAVIAAHYAEDFELLGYEP